MNDNRFDFWLRYGKTIYDDEYEVNGAFVRIRKVQYEGYVYTHIMVNGECVYFAEVGLNRH